MTVTAEYIRNLEETCFCGDCGGKIRVTNYPNFKCVSCGRETNINFFWDDKRLNSFKEGTMTVSPNQPYIQKLVGRRTDRREGSREIEEFKVEEVPKVSKPPRRKTKGQLSLFDLKGLG